MCTLLLALDLSIKNSGYCVFDVNTEELVEKGSVPCIPATRKAYMGQRRLSNDLKTTEYRQFNSKYEILDYISKELLTKVKKYSKDIVCIAKEGYGFGGSSLSNLAEAGGVCLTDLFRGNINTDNMILLAPVTVKKFITGQGKATKKEVQEGIEKKYGVPLDFWECDDESDAFVIGKIGVMYLNNNPKTKYEKEMIGRIKKSME